MPGTVTRRSRIADVGVTLEQSFPTGAGGYTDPVLLSGDVIAQVTAENAEATCFYRVERSTRDPANASPNWAVVTLLLGGKVGHMTLTGANGIEEYREPATGWWRVRVWDVTNGPVVAAISGGGAG